FAGSNPPQPSDELEEGSESPEERVDVGTEVNDMMMTLLPWGVSILLHAGMILISVFLVWTVAAEDTGEGQEEVIIPIARLSATPGGALSMQSGSNPMASTDNASARPAAAAAST